MAAAGLIATGVLAPLDVPAADLADFAGYVVWSLWLVSMAVVLLRGRRSPAPAAEPAVIVPSGRISG